MYYNMKALEDAGITQSDVDAVVTWDDYAALGKKYLDAIGNPDGKYFTSVDTGGTDWLWLAMSEYGEDWTFTSVDTGGTDWLWLAMSEYGEDWTDAQDAAGLAELRPG